MSGHQSVNQSASVWRFKPWWCQPWSIVLTGIVIMVGSGLLSHRVWVAGLVAVPILAWMGYFLLLYPKWVAESGLLPSEPVADDSPQR